MGAFTSCRLAGFGLFVLCLVCASTSSTRAQQPALVLKPTPLEALAAESGSRTTWSKYVGRLDGQVASAIVSAVTIESRILPAGKIRGVRIDLRHEGVRPDCRLKYVEWSILCDREQAAVYIEETRLPAFRTAVASGKAEVHEGHPYGVTYISSGGYGNGILIGGYCLYGPQLSDLVALLDAADAQLRSAPR